MKQKEITPLEIIERRIFLIRGQKVMLDADLADLYEVSTKNINRAVARNSIRFPSDFMFRLSQKEFENLRFQFGTSSSAISDTKQSRVVHRQENYGGRRYLPYVFTEHGVAMLSSVLNSPRAVQMNIFIIRAFIKLREMLATHKDLAQKMEDLERQQKENKDQIAAIRSVLTQLISVPSKPKKSIGFVPPNH